MPTRVAPRPARAGPKLPAISAWNWEGRRIADLRQSGISLCRSASFEKRTFQINAICIGDISFRRLRAGRFPACRIEESGQRARGEAVLPANEHRVDESLCLRQPVKPQLEARLSALDEAAREERHAQPRFDRGQDGLQGPEFQLADADDAAPRQEALQL